MNNKLNQIKWPTRVFVLAMSMICTDLMASPVTPPAAQGLTQKQLDQSLEQNLKSFRNNIQFSQDAAADQMAQYLSTFAATTKSAGSKQAVTHRDQMVEHTNTPLNKRINNQVISADETAAKDRLTKLNAAFQAIVSGIVDQANAPNTSQLSINNASDDAKDALDALQKNPQQRSIAIFLQQSLYWSARVNSCLQTFDVSSDTNNSSNNSDGKNAPSAFSTSCSGKTLQEIFSQMKNLPFAQLSQSLNGTLPGVEKNMQDLQDLRDEIDSNASLRSILQQASDWGAKKLDSQKRADAKSALQTIRTELNKIQPNLASLVVMMLDHSITDGSSSSVFPSYSTLAQADTYAENPGDHFDPSVCQLDEAPTSIASPAQLEAQTFITALSDAAGSLPKFQLPGILLTHNQNTDQDKTTTVLVGGQFKQSKDLNMSVDGDKIRAIQSNRQATLQRLTKVENSFLQQYRGALAQRNIALDNLNQLYAARTLNYAKTGSCTPQQIARFAANWRMDPNVHVAKTADGKDLSWNQYMQMAAPDTLARQMLYLLAEMRQQQFESMQMQQRLLATLSVMQLQSGRASEQQLSQLRSQIADMVKDYTTGQQSQSTDQMTGMVQDTLSQVTNVASVAGGVPGSDAGATSPSDLQNQADAGMSSEQIDQDTQDAIDKAKSYM